MILITIIIVFSIIHLKCLKQTAQGWGSVLKTEIGEVSKRQVMKTFTEPKGAMEDLFRVLERGVLNRRKQLGLPLLKDCLPLGWNIKCLQA